MGLTFQQIDKNIINDKLCSLLEGVKYYRKKRKIFSVVMDIGGTRRVQELRLKFLMEWSIRPHREGDIGKSIAGSGE